MELAKLSRRRRGRRTKSTYNEESGIQKLWSCIHIYAIAQNKSQRNLIFSEYYLKHAKIEKEEGKRHR